MNPKLVAEEVGVDNRYIWKIYDNYTLILAKWQNIKRLPYESTYTYGPKFMSYLKRLEPGKRYNFYGWEDDRPFERCFTEADGTYDIVITFYGFVPVKCKECGFETELSVCPNCGEWQHE